MVNRIDSSNLNAVARELQKATVNLEEEIEQLAEDLEKVPEDSPAAVNHIKKEEE